jgi:transcriptional antiterminator NusG
MGMQDKIFRVVVPEEEETDIKNGKKKVVKRKYSWLCPSGNRDD